MLRDFFSRLLKGQARIQLVAAAIIVMLLIPSIRTSIHADEIYGFVGLQGTGSWASPIEVITYPFSEAQLHYFLHSQGRIVPFSSMLYQGGFWLTTHISVLGHLSITTTYALLKAVLLVLMFFSYRAWLRLLAENFNVRNSAIWATNFALLTSLIFAIGSRLDSASINGFVTYPMLTYVPVILGFAIPMVIAKLLSSKSVRINAIGLGAAITIPPLLAFGYELNYIAFGASFLTLISLNREKFRNLGLAIWMFSISFIIAFIVNRWLVARACNVTNCYDGTEISISKKLLSGVVNNFLGVVPFKHSESNNLRSKGYGPLSFEPGLNSPIWWTISISVGFVAFILIKATTEQADELPKRLIFRIGAISSIVLLASCLLTSASSAAQLRLEDTVPYRGYMISWTAMSILFAAFVVVIVTVAKRRNWLVPVVMALSLVAGIMTLYLRPFSVMTITSELSRFNKGAFSQTYAEIIEPSVGTNANKMRCELLVDLGESRQANEVRKNIEPTFQSFHNIPFCK